MYHLPIQYHSRVLLLLTLLNAACAAASCRRGARDCWLDLEPSNLTFPAVEGVFSRRMSVFTSVCTHDIHI